jgi:hypothetical protein
MGFSKLGNHRKKLWAGIDNEPQSVVVVRCRRKLFSQCCHVAPCFRFAQRGLRILGFATPKGPDAALSALYELG